MMLERDLSPPVKKWLADQGYVVFVEQFDADIVGKHDNELVAVDLKLGHLNGLLWQALDRAEWADFVYVATPIKPKSCKRYAEHGIGVLLVTGDKVRRLSKAKQQPYRREKSRAYRIKKLSHMDPAGPDEQGGVATRHMREFYGSPRSCWSHDNPA